MTERPLSTPYAMFKAIKRRIYWTYFPFRVRYERFRLRHLAHKQTPLRIVVGASGVYEPDWLPTDIHLLNMLRIEDWEEYFSPSSIDAILAEHVWEHLTPEQGLASAINCHTYLRPGGYLRIAVPDGNHPDQTYIENVRPGGSGLGAEDHQVLYTYSTLSHMLKQAGFQVDLLEYFDEMGNFCGKAWDSAAGMVHRTSRFDERNLDGQLNYTSLLADAYKVNSSQSRSQ